MNSNRGHSYPPLYDYTDFLKFNLGLLICTYFLFFQYCEIQSTAGNGTGCITAQSRNSDSQRTGFAFVGGSITGTGENMLGRAYGSHSRVLFINTYMDDIILPHGWSDWVPTANSATRTRYVQTQILNLSPKFKVVHIHRCNETRFQMFVSNHVS